MNANELVTLIGEKYPLTELSSSPYESFKLKGMSFNVTSYKADGLGHVSLMTASGFFGLMKMDTLIIVSEEKDLPLFSYDRIKAMGNDTLIFELYDTLLSPFEAPELERIKEKYSSIPQMNIEKRWYESLRLSVSVAKKSKDSRTSDLLAREYFSAFLSLERDKTQDIEKKKEKSKAYVEGLLKNGGVSTDVLRKKFGEEKAEDLFRRVLFGVGE